MVRGVELGLGVVVVVGRWVDEYSQAASGDIVVNLLPLAVPLLPLCLLGIVGPAGGCDGPSCAAHLLGSGCTCAG